MQTWNPPVEITTTVPPQNKPAACNCAARIRAALPDMQPSAGHDELEELLGLLRVARADAKTYHDEALRLRKELLDLTRRAYTLPADIHACSLCGRPGATMHYPGGWLCPGGCESKTFGVAELMDK